MGMFFEKNGCAFFWLDVRTNK